MDAQRTRRSDRISMELAIQVSGSDGLGQMFLQDTRTIVLSLHGAKILLKCKLVPEQEITIRCISTKKEADARVAGQIGSCPEGYFYGVEFLDPNVNLWDIEFPPLTDSEQAVARVLLECARCHLRELVYLAALEAEVFEVNHCLSRLCKRCTDVSVWKLSTGELPSEQIPLPAAPPPPPTPPPASARSENERKEVRVSLSLSACVRHSQYGEEIVKTENVSRGGFRFKSPKQYPAGGVVEVAVPFTRGSGNIFTPARIEHCEELSSEGLRLYGVSYIQVHKGWPGD